MTMERYEFHVFLSLDKRITRTRRVSQIIGLYRSSGVGLSFSTRPLGTSFLELAPYLEEAPHGRSLRGTRLPTPPMGDRSERLNLLSLLEKGIFRRGLSSESPFLPLFRDHS